MTLDWLEDVDTKEFERAFVAWQLGVESMERWHQATTIASAVQQGFARVHQILGDKNAKGLGETEFLPEKLKKVFKVAEREQRRKRLQASENETRRRWQR